MHDVLPASVPLVVDALPPLQFASPDAQEQLAGRFRDLCTGERRTFVFVHSLILQDLTAEMVGVQLPFVPYLARRFRSFLPAILESDPQPTNRTRIFFTDMTRSFDQRNFRLVVASLFAVFDPYREIFEIIMPTIDGLPTLTYTKKFALADWAVVTPWDWEVTSFFDLTGLGIPLFVPSTQWMVPYILFHTTAFFVKWDLLRPQWKFGFLNGSRAVFTAESRFRHTLEWYSRTDFVRQAFVTHFDSFSHLLALLLTPGLHDRLRAAIERENAEREVRANALLRGAVQRLVSP